MACKTTTVLLPPPRSILQKPGKTAVLLVLPLVVALSSRVFIQVEHEEHILVEIIVFSIYHVSAGVSVLKIILVLLNFDFLSNFVGSVNNFGRSESRHASLTIWIKSSHT